MNILSLNKPCGYQNLMVLISLSLHHSHFKQHFPINKTIVWSKKKVNVTTICQNILRRNSNVVHWVQSYVCIPLYNFHNDIKIWGSFRQFYLSHVRRAPQQTHASCKYKDKDSDSIIEHFTHSRDPRMSSKSRFSLI